MSGRWSSGARSSARQTSAAVTLAAAITLDQCICGQTWQFLFTNGRKSLRFATQASGKRELDEALSRKWVTEEECAALYKKLTAAAPRDMNELDKPQKLQDVRRAHGAVPQAELCCGVIEAS